MADFAASLYDLDAGADVLGAGLSHASVDFGAALEDFDRFNFGAIATTNGIYLAGIASTDALGPLNVVLPLALALDGIPSSAALGPLGVITGLALASITGTAATGPLSVSRGILLDGIASTAALGPLTVLGPVYLDGIASTSALGPLAAITGIALDGIASSSALGPIGVARGIALDSIGSTAALGPLRVERLSTVVALQPDRGAVGTTLQLAAPACDMRTVSDTFSDGLMGALWTSSGAVEANGQVTLSGAQAYLRSASTLTNVDVRMTTRSTYTRIRGDDEPILAELALQGTQRAVIRAKLRAFTDIVDIYVGVGSKLVLLGSMRDGRGALELRLLRYGARVYVWAGGAAGEFMFEDGPAYFELCMNASSSTVETAIVRYARMPVVALGGEACLDARRAGSPTRVLASAPDHAAGSADLEVYGPVTTTLANAFTYGPRNRWTTAISRARM